MMSKLKPYPAMKDSGIDWLGEVPEHWNVRRLKYILREQDQRSTTGKEQLLRVSQYTGVTERRARASDGGQDSRAVSLVGYKIVSPNSLVVNIMLAWNGSMGVSRFNGICSPAYCVYCFSERVLPWYFHYLLRSPVYKARIKAVSTGVVESRLRLYTDDLFRIEGILPPPSEQAAVVRYLDYIERRVRNLVRAKRKLIALLNEQKQAIIHSAVTHGLDSKVPMKDSGVEWLGQVPGDWEVIQVRRLVSFITSGSRGWAKYYSDHGSIFLQSGNLGRTMSLNLSRIQHVSPPDGSEGIRTRVKKDDILVCITGALTGNSVIVEGELPQTTFVNQHVALVRPIQHKVYPRFLAYFLHSPLGQQQLKTSEYGGTKQGLGLDDVRTVWVPIPPKHYQSTVVAFLDAELNPIRHSIDRILSEIDLINEYRTRLISDVVTGKLDVRQAVANLPEVAPLAENDELDETLESDIEGDLKELEVITEEEDD